MPPPMLTGAGPSQGHLLFQWHIVSKVSPPNGSAQKAQAHHLRGSPHVSRGSALLQTPRGLGLPGQCSLPPPPRCYPLKHSRRISGSQNSCKVHATVHPPPAHPGLAEGPRLASSGTLSLCKRQRPLTSWLPQLPL